MGWLPQPPLQFCLLYPRDQNAKNYLSQTPLELNFGPDVNSAGKITFCETLNWVKLGELQNAAHQLTDLDSDREWQLQEWLLIWWKLSTPQQQGVSCYWQKLQVLRAAAVVAASRLTIFLWHWWELFQAQQRLSDAGSRKCSGSSAQKLPLLP